MSASDAESHDIYRERYHHKDLYRRSAEIPKEIKYLNFWRKQNSHIGIGQLESLEHLTATSVNDSFLDEICRLKTLDSLVLSKIEVEDIGRLEGLPNLRYLALVKCKPCEGLDRLKDMPSLKKLWIKESKEITDYWFLKGAKKLVALGVEGDIWTKQQVDSLEPFSNMLELEALFMSSVQLKDKNLDYVASNPKLKYFSVARFAPKSSFDQLRVIRPDLKCRWFDNYD
ncbi:hypothetical protein [Alcanivorax sp. 1008]|uniref:hypothetical protein n=1 Tax=Alcanivorax sp. 1008 TaxID=2816853 RepID=UPI001DED51EA|nr:hypothetical protein [Alcanivorax sp. 1008]MCC1496971.1 hypothetical protein [Alcanivorax sp. 1008]